MIVASKMKQEGEGLRTSMLHPLLEIAPDTPQSSAVPTVDTSSVDSKLSSVSKSQCEGINVFFIICIHLMNI